MNNLELSNVNKSYKNFKLKNVSFAVEEGSITGFIGRNGAGKTTTLKGIMDLVHFESGDVKVFGHDFFNNELKNKQKISFSLSEINYYPDYQLSRITEVTKAFYDEWDDELYKKLCKKFKLNDNKKVRELSSGMKVKYTLAVALSHNAKLFILDEPTSGLDPVSRDEILDIFKLLVKDGKRSILFSTHITSDLEKCADHIVYLRNGEVIADNSLNNFLNEYVLLNGKINSLEKIKDKVVSYKKVDGNFTALMLKENAVKIDKDIKVVKPDLEDIMVYHERSSEDEEITL